MCLQPWTRFTVAADAALYPCCVTDMQPVGSLERSATGDGIDAFSMRRFRHDLLVGNVPEPLCELVERAAGIDAGPAGASSPACPSLGDFEYFFVRFSRPFLAGGEECACCSDNAC
jgi:hypothetical protein